MIQRRQNLYLGFIVILCLILSYSTFSIAELSLSEASASKDVEKVVMTYSTNATTSSNGDLAKISDAKIQYILWCIAAFALFAILSFKKLKRQVTFCSFNFAFILFLPVFVYLDYSELAKIYTFTEIQIMGTAMISIALILFNFLAVRGVVKDFNLLKSMDRIR